MTLLDTMLNAYGLTAPEGATDDAKSALLIAHSQTVKQQIETLNEQMAAGNAVIEKLGAKTATEALAVLATMVPRAELSEMEGKMKLQDVQLVLLEGQTQGKFTMADCEPGKGWAHNTASQSPAVLRQMLPNLPAKVATGNAMKEFVGQLQTVQADKVVEQGPKSLTIGGAKYALTDETAKYDAAEIENLMDLAGIHGVEKLVKQGYLKAV
jgi:hypothetical protein